MDRYVEALGRDGCAVMPIGELTDGATLYTALERAAAALTGEASYVEKDYLRYMLGETPPLDLASPYARLALHPDIRAVVDGYLGMYSQLRFYNLWETPPGAETPEASQLWHRDRDDRRIVKGFLYLCDVDATNGPFRFAKGTHRRGDLCVEAPARLEGHIPRSTDAQLASVVPQDRMNTFCGPAGTLILADTTAYHCGGFATERARLLFTFMYTSRASETREWFDRSESGRPTDPGERFAVGAGRHGPAYPGARR